MSEEHQEKKSTIYLVIAGLILIAILGIIYYRIHYTKPEQKTNDELLQEALTGTLPVDKGYVYNKVYPFVTDNDFWYTQIRSPKGTKLYDLAFRYGPREVSSVHIEGTFNETTFNNYANVIVTFDPIGGDLTHIQLAVADFDTMIVQVFGKVPLAACTRNETAACANRPIVTCENSKIPVIYFRSSDTAGVFMNDNCVILSGHDFDIVKSTDRYLLGILGIMPW